MRRHGRMEHDIDSMQPYDDLCIHNQQGMSVLDESTNEKEAGILGRGSGNPIQVTVQLTAWYNKSSLPVEEFIPGKQMANGRKQKSILDRPLVLVQCHVSHTN